jgi:AcrR family transcriptional regulator
MGKREENAAQTRQRVVDAAISSFGERGFEATTMESIAHAVGIGSATLYRHFPSKESILISLAEPGLRRVGDLLEARPVDESLSVAMGAALDQWMEEAAPDSDFGQQVYRHLMSVSELHRQVLQIWDDERHRIERELRRRVGAGEDELWVDVTAHVMVMMCAIVFERLRGDMHDGAALAMLRSLSALMRAPAFVTPAFAVPETT